MQYNGNILHYYGNIMQYNGNTLQYYRNTLQSVYYAKPSQSTPPGTTFLSVHYYKGDDVNDSRGMTTLWDLE